MDNISGVGAATYANELLNRINRDADCPIHVQKVRDICLSWGDDPLDFIYISPKQAKQLIERLKEALHG